jgi:hypothetical protein
MGGSMAKKINTNNYEITVDTIRKMKRQLMASRPIKFPMAYFMDIFVKGRGWFRVTGFAVFEISEIHEELSFRILSDEEEDEILKTIEAQFDAVKK